MAYFIVISSRISTLGVILPWNRENVLIVDETVKLADFGSCRGIYSKQPYTEYISTRWYRAPECLLTDGYYNYKVLLPFKEECFIISRWIFGDLDVSFSSCWAYSLYSLEITN